MERVKRLEQKKGFSVCLVEDELSGIYYRSKYPLHAAVDRGDICEIGRLLEKDPSLISKRDISGRLPIHYVHSIYVGDKVSVNGAGVLEYLYQHGACFKEAAEAKVVFDPLIYRCSFEPDILKVLLEHEADDIINWRDRYGNTILHSLFDNLNIYNVCGEKENLSKCMKSIELVMKHGGKKIINTLTKSDYTPLDLLRDKSKNLVSDFRYKYGAKYSSWLSK